MLRHISILFLSIIFTSSLTLALLGLSLGLLLDQETYVDALPPLDDTLVDEERILEVIPEIVNETLEYVQGESEDLNFDVVLNEYTVDILRDEISLRPSCENATQELCKPQGVSDEDLLAVALDNMEKPGLPNSDLQLGFDPREVVAIGKYIFFTSIFLTVLCASLILFLSRKSISSGMRWLETDLIFVGSSAALSAYTLTKQLPSIIPLEGKLLLFVHNVLAFLLDALFAYGVAVFIGGLILFLITVLVGSIHIEKK